MPRVIVLHASYGCDTGCCGHVVEVDGEQVGGFSFSHPSYPSHKQSVPDFIRELVINACGIDHVQDIDWDNCIVSDD